MAIIHWLGAGLSSAPGIKRLISNGAQLWLWNRTVSKACAVIETLDGQCQARELDWQQLAQSVGKGDVLVSMLPGSFHVQVAQLALDNHAHFVSSSYLSQAMVDLHQQALDKGLCLVNEVGLDPGIDHLLAYALVNEYRQSAAFKQDNRLEFRSFCGGLPAEENDFKYKFSWSPLGVLTALKSKAKWREDGEVKTNTKPWCAVRDYSIDLSHNHTATFEAIPNRDSIPFISQYQFDPKWTVDTFIRGSLRLAGWADAWKGIFDLVASAQGPDGMAKLKAKSDELWQKHAFKEGEQDRVVLHVELLAKDAQTKQGVWRQSYSMDAFGNEQGSAMARLVSTTVSLAVEAVLAQRISAGVSAAPNDVALVSDWLGYINDHHDVIHHLNHLSD
ncbi:MAG: saccharopine dehydrogenase NADP-binding domain-containing protein [Oceanospirillaceae bacterium]|nr:saccharopine dehydrogenase NADP-binding domain-containing protein [Oceanospirillaceae bacterium]